MAFGTSRVGIVSVPARYEALRDSVGPNRVSQVLLEPTADMPILQQVIAEVRASRQGKLLFIQGDPGSGKTSLAEALAIYLGNAVGAVLTSPPDFELALPELPGWIAKERARINVSPDKLVVVNLDGREITSADRPATVAAMTNLNALLRRTPDMLLLWPIINRSFADDAIEQLSQVGGQTALSVRRVHQVIGIPQERYYDVLALILQVMGVTLADAAVSSREAQDMVTTSKNLGDYLEAIQGLVVSRYDLGELGGKLPKISFVVSSNADANPICRMLRRGNGYLIDPDRLLQFSRANIADDWRRRATTNARHALPFIASLFDAKLLSVSSSAVVNACAFAEDTSLGSMVRVHYPSPVSSNAWNSMVNSSFARALLGQEDVGRGASSPSDAILKAYKDLQAVSKTKHRALNEAIMRVIETYVIGLPTPQFEYHPVVGKELRADVWLDRPDRPETLEFTHRADVTEAVVSSYILTKLQDYARDYGLI